jgi:hypothetical protein
MPLLHTRVAEYTVLYMRNMRTYASSNSSATTYAVQFAKTSSQLVAMTAGEAASLQLSILLSLAHAQYLYVQTSVLSSCLCSMTNGQYRVADDTVLYSRG